MKITLTRAALSKELALLDKVVEGKATIPILQHILLTVWPTGVASFAAMNGSEYVVSDDIACNAVETDGPTQLALPAHLLLAIAKVVADGEVTIEAKSATHAELRAGTTKMRLPLADPKDFPEIPNLTETVAAVPAGQLREVLRQTKYAAGASTYGMRTPCVGVELDSDVRALATDGHRFAMSYRPLAAAVEAKKFVLPIRAAAALDGVLEAADKEAPVSIALSENVACFRVGARMIATRLVDQPFTAYKKILRAKHKTIAELPREAFLLALRRLGVTATTANRAVTMTFENDAVELKAGNNEADGEDRVPCVVKGPAITVRLNLAYVAEVFALLTADTINAGFQDDVSPVEFGPVDPGVTAVVMVLRA